jgi:hypothetical protein
METLRLKAPAFNQLLLMAFLWLPAAGVAAPDEQALPAFPGAEGFGAYSKGGRGGQVLRVTTLADNGPGSLRWAVEQEGPRTVVFDVSGTIRLQDSLSIRNPCITIAGQTAPGDGICLSDAGLGIAANDVIVRYIRCRLGDQGRGGDAISIGRGEDIIVDHCSASWSTDEVLSASSKNPSLTRVTVQWCFITEALNPRGHGYGSLIRGTGGAKYSFLHNLYAHNHGRNPRPGNYDINPHEDDPEGLLLDFRNNVIYNWGGGHAGYNNDLKSVTRLNYVGNYLIPGSDSKRTGIAYSTCSPYNRAFFDGNRYDGELPDDPWKLVKYRDAWTADTIRAYKQSRAFEAGPVREEDAVAAFQRVMRSGGASLPKRDAVDSRVVMDIENGSGRIINSQDEVGGWPELTSSPAPVDSDGDGMPDVWEKANGLNPSDPEDRNAIGGGGYTRLEDYLNELCVHDPLPSL